MTHLFTPRMRGSNARVEMQLSDDDIRKIERGHPWDAIVTDVTTGKRYSVRGAPCSLPTCYCDAVAEELH